MSAIDAIRGQEIKVLKFFFIFTLLSSSVIFQGAEVFFFIFTLLSSTITFQGAEVFFYFHIVITYYPFSRC